MTIAFGTACPPKVALYSHDTMGLGHLRRNLLIAGTLARPPLNARVLLIAGAREAGSFDIPAGVDCITLPAYRKDRRGHYSARSLGLETSSLRALRSATMDTVLTQFAPEMFVVDNVPRGALEELTPVLERLRFDCGTCCVLGLRDVLDDPAQVRRQWRRLRNEEAVRDFYDAVWIYGDRRIYDAVSEYEFSAEMVRKIQFTGYLDQMGRLGARAGADTHDGGARSSVSADLNGRDFTLCVVGGGQDGAAVARAFCATVFPPGECGVLVTGPYLPKVERRRLVAMTALNPRLKVMTFLPEPIGLVSAAKRVIAMGGYNTVMEILSLGKRALLIPRERPRLEQTIRARRLKALGLLDYVAPDALNAGVLSDWIRSDGALTSPRSVMDFSGLIRLPQLVDNLLSSHCGPVLPGSVTTFQARRTDQ